MRFAGLLSERFDPFGAVRAVIVLFSVRLLFCSWRAIGKSGGSLRFSRRWYALSGVGVIIGLYGLWPELNKMAFWGSCCGIPGWRLRSTSYKIISCRST